MISLWVSVALAVSSQVTDVTVYNDRARVTRSAEVELQAGVNTLRFETLPESVDARGLQVDGAGAATVLDVRFKTEYFESIPQEQWKALYAQEEELTQEEQALAQRVAVLQQGNEFLEKISDKVTHASDKSEAPAELNPESWEKMLDLYINRRMEYDKSIRAADVELKAVREKLAKVQGDLKAAGANQRKERRVVEVDLDAAQAGKANVQLSYLVQGPRWTPTYDVRVNTESRELELRYFALVQQNSGEDWGDVVLKLSTANPSLGGEHPELQPWPVWGVAARQGAHRKSMVAADMPWSAPVGYNSFETRAIPGMTSVGVAESAMEQVEAEAESKGASVVFAVAGKSTIENDKAEHRVAVTRVNMPVHLRYSTVPKLDPHAYLKAKATNGGDYPFLAGKANVFLNGDYVATSQLDLVAPNEEFWVFLGVDESMKVEHQLVKKYESSEGFTGRTVRHMYEYQFTLKNTHGTREEMIVWDHLPISGSEDIKVKLLEPHYSKDSDALKMDEEQRLQWLFKLNPCEEKVVLFKFYVEAPKGLTIEGLD